MFILSVPGAAGGCLKFRGFFGVTSVFGRRDLACLSNADYL